MLAAVDEVLDEIGAAERPRLLALNKVDLLDDERRRELASASRGAVQVSAETGEGLEELREAVEARFLAHACGRWSCSCPTTRAAACPSCTTSRGRWSARTPPRACACARACPPAPRPASSASRVERRGRERRRMRLRFARLHRGRRRADARARRRRRLRPARRRGGRARRRASARASARASRSRSRRPRGPRAAALRACAARHGIALVNAPGPDRRGLPRRGARAAAEHRPLRQPFEVAPGDRIAQLVIVRHEAPELVEVAELGRDARGAGGFGSTGR